MTVRKTAALLALVLVSLLAACAAGGGGEEISKERAIELARQHVNFETFEPGRIEAERTTEADRPVWRVTFYGKDVTADHPGHVEIVTLDRKTGELVSLAKS
jgi:tellurite resistance protein